MKQFGGTSPIFSLYGHEENSVHDIVYTKFQGSNHLSSIPKVTVDPAFVGKKKVKRGSSPRYQVYQEYDCMLIKSGAFKDEYYKMQIVEDNGKGYYTFYSRHDEQIDQRPSTYNAQQAINQFEQMFCRLTKNQWENRNKFRPCPNCYVYSDAVSNDKITCADLNVITIEMNDKQAVT